MLQPLEAIRLSTLRVYVEYLLHTASLWTALLRLQDLIRLLDQLFSLLHRDLQLRRRLSGPVGLVALHEDLDELLVRRPANVVDLRDRIALDELCEMLCELRFDELTKRAVRLNLVAGAIAVGREAEEDLCVERVHAFDVTRR